MLGGASSPAIGNGSESLPPFAAVRSINLIGGGMKTAGRVSFKSPASSRPTYAPPLPLATVSGAERTNVGCPRDLTSGAGHKPPPSEAQTRILRFRYDTLVWTELTRDPDLGSTSQRINKQFGSNRIARDIAATLV